MLSFILYMCLMCCTHMRGLISCCHCPCTDVETEAQRGPCFPMLLAELGLALLHSGKGHVCGDPSYLPHHFLLPQKYYAVSFMPPCLGSRSSCSWKPSLQHTLSSSPGWSPAFRTQPGPPELTLSPGVAPSGYVLFVALSTLQCYMLLPPSFYKPFGVCIPCHKCELLSNVNSSLKNLFCHLTSYIRSVISVF